MILFDGGSYAYGHELENPEIESYPYLFAKMGLMEGASSRRYANIAKNGKSNDAIVRTTIEFCTNNIVSSVIIQFAPYSWRERMAYCGKLYYNMTPYNKDEKSIEYFEKMQNLHDDVSNFHKNRYILENFLQKRNIKYYFIELQRREDIVGYIPSSWYHLVNKTPITNFRDILGKQIENEQNFTNGHPSKLGHQLIARHLYENFY